MTPLRPYFLALASLVIPGLGQALRGDFGAGLLWFASAVLLAMPSGGAGFPFVGVLAAIEAYGGARPAEDGEFDQ